MTGNRPAPATRREQRGHDGARMNIGSDAVFRIVNLTLPHLREGLDFRSAAATALIIREVVGVSAVALSDEDHILAFVGDGSDHHRAGLPILTHLTRETLLTGKVTAVSGVEAIGCPVAGCPLRAAIVAPLTTRRPRRRVHQVLQRERGAVRPTRRSSSPPVWPRCSRSNSGWPRSTCRSS